MFCSDISSYPRASESGRKSLIGSRSLDRGLRGRPSFGATPVPRRLYRPRASRTPECPPLHLAQSMLSESARGPAFRTIHLLFDRVAKYARNCYDHDRP